MHHPTDRITHTTAFVTPVVVVVVAFFLILFCFFVVVCVDFFLLYLTVYVFVCVFFICGGSRNRFCFRELRVEDYNMWPLGRILCSS